MAEPKYSIPEAPKGWDLVRMLGPGIIWAGMAIGGGELTLNPRVGAVFGIITLWMPVLAIFLKWFMTVEIGRWSIYTGTSIREGFELLPGPRKWLNWIILLIGLYLGAVHIGGLVAMIGIVAHNLLPFLAPYVWSIIIMVSFVLLSWSGKYSILERAMMVAVAMLTITTFLVFIKIWPGLEFIMQGFTFKIPTVTPEWAVTNFKISSNPLVEILPAMAFAGAGAINSLWYSDWILAKGFGVSAKYQLGSSNTTVLSELKNLSEQELHRLKGWFRVMLHDSWWGANLLTIVVTAIFVVNAVVILHPLKLAPSGVNFILTLSKTFTEALGSWAKTLYLIGAFAVLYTTMATLYDGYARLIDNSIRIVLPNWTFYNEIHSLWRYRIWFLYGTLCNFLLVYLFNAVPVTFLQAASWIEGTFMLPIVAFSIVYLTNKVLPELYGQDKAHQVKPNWIFTAGTILAGCFYGGLIIYSFFL
ncbi:Nramp family divalent metal transporter [Moorellaceae bacterium AZ2]